MIYRKKNVFFFLIRKNMSQAMDTILKCSNFQELNHIPQISKDCTTVTIIREPLDRFISTYVMLINDYRHNKDIPFKGAKFTKDTLKNFISSLEKKCFNGHLRSQVDFLPVKIDLYLIQENIKKDLMKIPVGLTIPWGKLEKINAQDPKLKRIVRKQLTPKLIKKLKQIYKEDFLLYGRCRNKRKRNK